MADTRDLLIEVGTEELPPKSLKRLSEAFGTEIAAGLDGALDFEQVASTERPAPDVPRSPDDMLFLYTGGTTGMPKGVMWRQGDLYHRFAGGGLLPAPETLEGLVEYASDPEHQLRALIGPPLMHGTG